jgi:protein-disulfide isomerase
MPLYRYGLSHNQGINEAVWRANILCISQLPSHDIHPHAQHAAEAAEAAAAQDKFWLMHDYLFEHQKALDDRHLLEYAQKVGLDLDKYRSEMSGHIYAPLVNKSLKSGIDSRVGGTPTFFINGQRYEDSYDFDTLTRFIKKSLPR